VNTPETILANSCVLCGLTPPKADFWGRFRPCILEMTLQNRSRGITSGLGPAALPAIRPKPSSFNKQKFWVLKAIEA
jgi:hypothetical protein